MIGHRVSLGVLVALAGCHDADAIERGRLLVAVGGCAECHTPRKLDPVRHMPVPDPTRLLAGHPEGAPDPAAIPGATDQAVIGPTFTSFTTGFGIVYSRNLTPDNETGLGTWSEGEFIASMRTGHRKGNQRVMLPPMPWQNLAAMPDDDLRAVYAYLRSIPPVVNRVPEPKVSAEAIAAFERATPATRP